MKSGFTLIELLVVIAIIGILASIVLSSMNEAREGGFDVAIKANLAGLRAQAELYLNKNSNYGKALAIAGCQTSSATAGNLFLEASMKEAIDAARKANGGTDLECVVVGSPSTAWAVSSKLRDGTNWCVNSAGASKSGQAKSDASCQ